MVGSMSQVVTAGKDNTLDSGGWTQLISTVLSIVTTTVIFDLVGIKL